MPMLFSFLGSDDRGVGRRRVAGRVRCARPDALILDGLDRTCRGLGGADGSDTGTLGNMLLLFVLFLLLGWKVFGAPIHG